MLLDGLPADEQLVCDLDVVLSLRQQSEDLCLANTQGHPRPDVGVLRRLTLATVVPVSNASELGDAGHVLVIGACGSALKEPTRHFASAGCPRRRSPVDPQLPVIMLTGRASETDRVRRFARGADDYLVKPMRSSRPLPQGLTYP
jgi:hypothetical protein